MRRSFGTYRQYNIPTVSIDESQIIGSGGVYAPVLRVPLRLDCSFGRFLSGEAIQFRWLRATIRLPTGEELSAKDAPLDLRISADYTPNDFYVGLEFPLDAARSALLEKSRNGNDLKVRICLQLDVDQLHAVAEIQKEPWQVLAWAYVQNHKLSTEDDLSIPRSSWLDRVLPHIGYGMVHVVELPVVPLTEIESYRHAFSALQQAQTLHRNGHYDESVSRSRMALEQFFEKIDSGKVDDDGRPKYIPKLKAEWEVKLGLATHQWLDSCLIAMKDLGNRASHSPKSHFDQFESQMILSIVTALVSFALRSGVNPQDKIPKPPKSQPESGPSTA